MPAEANLRMFEWADLHHLLQWVYRGPVASGGRGYFQSSCGGAAWYLLSGEAVLRHGGCEFRARRGDWLFPNQGSHERDFSVGAKILSLRFNLEWPDGQPLFDLTKAVVIRGAEYPQLLRRAKVLEKVVYQSGKQKYAGVEFVRERLDFPAYAEIDAAMLAWSKTLYLVFKAAGVRINLDRFQDARVVRALRIMDDWPLQHSFTMKPLIEMTRISRAQLDRLFSIRLGQTARQYFDRRRLRHAERNLSLPYRTIKEVAFAVGFQHVSSFSAWFKQNTGVNPNVWRERAMSPEPSGPSLSQNRETNFPERRATRRCLVPVPPR